MDLGFYVGFDFVSGSAFEKFDVKGVCDTELVLEDEWPYFVALFVRDEFF